jgi:hypothetical protein
MGAPDAVHAGQRACKPSPRLSRSAFHHAGLARAAPRGMAMTAAREMVRATVNSGPGAIEFTGGGSLRAAAALGIFPHPFQLRNNVAY